MNKVNGIYLDNEEIKVIQRLISELIGTDDPNEIAKKSKELFKGHIGAGLFILDFMKA